MEERKMKKKTSQKRNKLPLLLGALLLISLAAYGTRAYFSDSATEQTGIELKLGNVQIISKSSGWTYNKEGKAGQATLHKLEGEKVSYTNVSSGDTFTKKFVFKNVGNLRAQIKIGEQNIVEHPDANSLSNENQAYSYNEGPYAIEIISNNGKFDDLVTGTSIEPGGTLEFEMKISPFTDLDNKYNDNKDGGDKNLEQIALDLLGKKVSVDLTELSKK